MLIPWEIPCHLNDLPVAMETNIRLPRADTVDGFIHVVYLPRDFIHRYDLRLSSGFSSYNKSEGATSRENKYRMFHMCGNLLEFISMLM